MTGIRSGALLAALALVLAGASASAALAPEEAAIVAHVDAQAAAARALLQKVVDIDSPSEDVAGVRRLGEVFAQELQSAGLATRWIGMPAGMNRAGHLLAETRGTRGRRLLLLGHIDTVLAGERFRVEGTRAWGTGISDMKGGAVVLVQALQALAAAGVLADMRIAVLLTGDEEDIGLPVETARAVMVEQALQSDAVLSFEASIDDTGTIGRRGAGSWTLEVGGRTGHSSQIFAADMGSGAIFEAARILDAFRRELAGEQYLTFNPSLILGGSRTELADFAGQAEGKTNVVPGTAVVRGDLRFISAAQEQAARERMQAIVARHLPHTEARLEFHESYPAMTPSAGNEALLRDLDAVSRDLGLGAVAALDPGRRGAGDIGFVSHLKPGLDGLGIGAGGNSHAPGEWAQIDSLPRVTSRAAVLLYRLTR